MNRYLTLNLNDKNDALYFGRKFLNDRDEWKKKIKKQQRELDSIAELPAISNSEVHSGNISKPTENAAFARMKVQDKIKQYEDYETVLTYGLNHISAEDRELIEKLYYTRNRMKSAIVDELATARECTPRKIYKAERIAVLNFVDAVREIINE